MLLLSSGRTRIYLVGYLPNLAGLGPLLADDIRIRTTLEAPIRITHCGDSSRELQHFAALAQSFGVTAENVEVRSDADLESAFISTTGDSVVVIDVESVARVLPDTAAKLKDILRQAGMRAFLLVTTSTDATSRYLECITAGTVSATYVVDGSTVPIKFNTAFAQELRGHSFERRAAPILCLATRGGDFETIMSVDGRPTFGRIAQPSSEASIFVWSTQRVFDVNKPLQAEVEFEVATDQYLPVLIYLKSVFGERCWHTRSAAAGLVIDDSLLRRRYGCIDFEKLLASARLHRYHVTVAFIPWNHWRTRRREAELFRNYSDVFSICVHGNDHTKSEFHSEDEQDLVARADEAVTRMESHCERTGIPYEAIMVCPQERYSVKALRAIGDSKRFAVVVNARCIPDDPAATGQVSAADLLLPAQDSWFGMPILKRHYAADGMAQFALALFLGRPAILVEHHDAFHSGTDSIENFAAEVRKISPHVRWAPLGETIKRLCWQRRVSEGLWSVRFFADSFELVHDADETVRYDLSKRVSGDAVVDSVTVNGVPVSFSLNGRMLQFVVDASSRSVFRIAVAVRSCMDPTPRSVTLAYRAKVAVRRVLSEVRDSVLSRSVVATRIARTVMRALQQTTPCAMLYLTLPIA